ncbi:TPA: hypothetical protein QCH82_002905 [Enterobacter kobei]|nr:hypothetical protein [Enterobacter kobei]
MTDLQNNKEMIAVGHEFARTLSSDTPIIEIAKMITRLAGSLDCVTLALREMTKQRDSADQAERVWERTMMDACGEDGPKSVADKFAALEQNLAESQREFRAADATIENMQMQVEKLAAENAELKHAMAVTLEHVSVMDAGQAGVAAMIINDALHHSETPATDAFLAEVRALAAENAGLKAANAEGCKWDGEQWVGISIQTPATEAFLAEVRAQGVDSAINTVIAMMNHQHPVTSKAIDIMRVHAYQIRKGVQS